jgi:uncharacterized protein YdiU (UPF0061 family)
VRSGELCASWMVAGFVHGVLNTDNMNVTGESFDYGPYRFLPTYDPGFVAAYFDHSGLYAFGRQPEAVHWNLARLAESLLTLTTEAALQRSLDAYEPALMAAVHRRFLDRLGLAPRGADDDEGLVDACYAFMRESGVGYDRFFFDWYGGAASERRAAEGAARALYDGPSFAALRRRLESHAPARPAALAGAYFQGDAPCSLLIDEIESIWEDIAERDDWGAFNQKIVAIRTLAKAYGRG